MRYREPPQLDDPDEEQLWQTARVLGVLDDPEAIKVLRLLAIRPQSPESIHAVLPGLPGDEVAQYLSEFSEAGLVIPYSKSGWCQLTELGRLAIRAVRVLG